MKIRLAGALVLVASLVVVHSTVMGGGIKSGPDKKISGPFDVKAITGDRKGDTLCYVCKYNAEARPGVVLIFSRKADDNIANLVKAVDSVQKNNAKLGTVLVGVGGVTAA